MDSVDFNGPRDLLSLVSYMYRIVVLWSMASGVDFEETRKLDTVHHLRSRNGDMTVTQLYVGGSVVLGVDTLDQSQTALDLNWIRNLLV